MAMFTTMLTAAAAFLSSIIGAPPAVAVDCAPRAANAAFRVFNGMSFAGQPDLSRYGFEPIHIIDRGVWRNEDDHRGPPDPQLVRQVLGRLPDDGGPVVIDFEDIDPAGSNAQTTAIAVRRLVEVEDAFRTAAPGRRFGFYSTLPGRDYWRAIRGAGTAEYRAWQTENNRLAALERHTDLLFPSLYTFYANPAGWQAYARAQICEARRLSSKPVYVFLWFEYHPSAREAGQFLPARFWRLQLETARRYADGVVIWGGYNLQARGPRTWDANAPWWRETLAFMARRRTG